MILEPNWLQLVMLLPYIDGALAPLPAFRACGRQIASACSNETLTFANDLQPDGDLKFGFFTLGFGATLVTVLTFLDIFAVNDVGASTFESRFSTMSCALVKSCSDNFR